MKLEKIDNKLIIKDGFMTTLIEPCGKDSVRVRATIERNMDKNDWALDEYVENHSEQKAEIKIEDVEILEPWYKNYPNPEEHVQKFQIGTLKNGRMIVKVNFEGWISFYDGEKLLLEEFWQNRRRIDRFCIPTNLDARELKPNYQSLDYKATVRFASYDDECLYGMGQYQDGHLNKKGSFLELAQRNSQSSVPFVISSRGYGFLWNNPAVGSASFATNGTTWTASNTKKIDYWITTGTPSEIEENYTEVTGRAPKMPDYAMGFWQCKLRYSNQDEVLKVAREYKKRGLPLSVIVIDFFHWSMQGDFKFDKEDWPNPEEMVSELKKMGIKLMVSVWPTIDERSENYQEMAEKGLLIGFAKGQGFNMDWMGNTVFFDTTNPETRKYVWQKCKENYLSKGIDLFWLDEAEPEYGIYDFEKFKYHIGSALECSNIYPKFYAKGFYDGLVEEKVENPISLVRCVWVGSQKYGTVVWSGDVHSDFKSLKNQLQAGLSMNIAGIPWWTTDIGGFLGGDILSPSFRELIVRWFEWAVFCPVMRLHGERPPFKKLEKQYHDVRGYQVKQMESGQDNEVWSFGEDVYSILTKLLELRTRLKPYIAQIMEKAHSCGEPVMRPLFYDFATDSNVYKIEDEYMFGSKLLVCPVTDEGCTERNVYLPKLDDEKWIDCASGIEYEGGRTLTVKTPLSLIPVFSRGQFDIKIW